MGRRRKRRLIGAGAVLLAMLAVTLCAPWLATHDPRAAVPADHLQGPSRTHLLGTDLLGRDIFSRVLYGGQRALATAGLALLVAMPAGLLIGACAGFGPLWIDRSLMPLVDALLAFPALLLALALVTLLGQGTVPLALAVGIAGIAGYARVARAAVRAARAQAFVEAARAIGAGRGRTLWFYILPAAAPTLLSFGGVTLSWALLNSTALAFLGYGGDIGAPDWGVMLASGRATFRVAPWGVLAPGAALSILVLALNVLAGELADWDM